jgi:hypothetical protein
MIKKLISIILILLISFHYLLSDTGRITLAKPLTLELKNNKKFETHLLCFTEKGFVVWNSSYKHKLSDISKYAEYYTYDELEYFQLGGKMNFIPIAIGGATIITGVAFPKKNDESGAGLFNVLFIGLGCVLVTFITLFIPRRYQPHRESEVRRFPSKYIAYKNDIPEELKKFIAIHEK